MVIGYIDGSFKNVQKDKQQELLKAYARKLGLTIDVYFTEGNISQLSANIQTGGHTLIVANVVSLGDSLKTITQNIKDFVSKGNTIYFVSERLKFQPDEATAELIKGLELAANIRSSMNSIITKNVLHEKRAKGQKLGRAFGTQNKKSILKDRGDFIMKALSEGRTKADIARELNISWRAVYNVEKQYERRQA